MNDEQSNAAIKPIETDYRGVRFRSRLEARWAVFFDAAGIPWTYEPEAYEFDGERYLPDFHLPREEAYVEIKPNLPDAEYLQKLQRFGELMDRHVFLAFDLPRTYDCRAIGAVDRMNAAIRQGRGAISVMGLFLEMKGYDETVWHRYGRTESHLTDKASWYPLKRPESWVPDGVFRTTGRFERAYGTAVAYRFDWRYRNRRSVA